MITLIMASRVETEALQNYLHPLFFENHAISVKPANTSDFHGKLHYLFQVPPGAAKRGLRLQRYLAGLLEQYAEDRLFCDCDCDFCESDGNNARF